MLRLLHSRGCSTTVATLHGRNSVSNSAVCSSRLFAGVRGHVGALHRQQAQGLATATELAQRVRQSLAAPAGASQPSRWFSNDEFGMGSGRMRAGRRGRRPVASGAKSAPLNDPVLAELEQVVEKGLKGEIDVPDDDEEMERLLQASRPTGEPSFEDLLTKNPNNDPEVARLQGILKKIGYTAEDAKEFNLKTGRIDNLRIGDLDLGPVSEKEMLAWASAYPGLENLGLRPEDLVPEPEGSQPIDDDQMPSEADVDSDAEDDDPIAALKAHERKLKALRQQRLAAEAAAAAAKSAATVPPAAALTGKLARASVPARQAAPAPTPAAPAKSQSMFEVSEADSDIPVSEEEEGSEIEGLSDYEGEEATAAADPRARVPHKDKETTDWNAMLDSMLTPRQARVRAAQAKAAEVRVLDARLKVPKALRNAGGSSRAEKVQETVVRVVSDLLLDRLIRDPLLYPAGLPITITRAKMSNDIQHVVIYWTLPTPFKLLPRASDMPKRHWTAPETGYQPSAQIPLQYISRATQLAREREARKITKAQRKHKKRAEEESTEHLTPAMARVVQTVNQALLRNAPVFRRHLAQRCHLKYVPTIAFRRDAELERPQMDDSDVDDEQDEDGLSDLEAQLAAEHADDDMSEDESEPEGRQRSPASAPVRQRGGRVRGRASA